MIDTRDCNITISDVNKIRIELINDQDNQQTRRARFNYPASDDNINRWLAAQQSKDISIQMLIKRDIKKYGYVDVIQRQD